LLAKAREPLRRDDSLGLANEAMNRNTWLPYVPSAPALLAGRLFNEPALVLLYTARLANLAGYIALTWAALRLIPAGRIILLTVALMPMVIHQAASLSWDSIAFGIGFLYCAMVIRCAMADRVTGAQKAAVISLTAIVG
jgi:uncharacterized membrane protein